MDGGLLDLDGCYDLGRTMNDKTLWRDIIGNLVAATVVLSFCALGYVQIFVFSVSGVTVAVSSTWENSLGGLASFALGYLVKAAEQKVQQIVQTAEVPKKD
jgi:hypothetical protein